MDVVYAECAPKTGRDHARWEAQVPCDSVRGGLRQFKIGAVPQLAVNAVKRIPAFGRLTPAARTVFLRCPCGVPGQQDARHFVYDCGYSQPARDAALADMDAVLATAVATTRRPGLVADLVAWWTGLDARAKLRWMLSSKGPRPPQVEKFLRGPGCAAWVPAMRLARDRLVVANAPMLAALATAADAP